MTRNRQKPVIVRKYRKRNKLRTPLLHYRYPRIFPQNPSQPPLKIRQLPTHVSKIPPPPPLKKITSSPPPLPKFGDHLVRAAEVLQSACNWDPAVPLDSHRWWGLPYVSPRTPLDQAHPSIGTRAHKDSSSCERETPALACEPKGPIAMKLAVILLCLFADFLSAERARSRSRVSSRGRQLPFPRQPEGESREVDQVQWKVRGFSRGEKVARVVRSIKCWALISNYHFPREAVDVYSYRDV